MDTSATLPEELIHILSTYNQTLMDTGSRFETARQELMTPERSFDQTIFEDSLKLKRTLDVVTAFNAPGPFKSIQKPEELLALIINCEYQLYKLNATTPLLSPHPFLSHWVEFVQEWEPHILKRAADGKPQRTIEQVIAVRLNLVKLILDQKLDQTVFPGVQTPSDVAKAMSGTELQPYNLDPFINVLEMAEIYDRTPGPQASQDRPVTTLAVDSEPSSSHEKAKEADGDSADLNAVGIDNWLAEIFRHLDSDPIETLTELAHLPLEIPSLELINKLLAHEPAPPVLDRAKFVRNFLQNCLRTLEASASSNREDQTRGIKLLVLFMGNLIKKGMLGPEEIYWEIQEVVVRYMWVSEVMIFRKFLEEGEIGEGES